MQTTHTQQKVSIKVTDTASGKKLPLETLKPGKLTLYSCGPTVYNLVHIGNLRSALVSDLFFRVFKRFGYDVTYVRNYTDVDDKIIKKAVEEKLTALEVADKYIKEVEKDFAAAGVLEPTHKTRVTTHMPEIISLIEEILKNGKAYVAEDGEVLFSISSFENYGKLSRKPLDDLIAGHRVEVSSKKKNPLDFTLWKPAKPGEPFWTSPWGNGRPGWHIECSAMARKWLGDQIDVHHGGEDLIFPHHENEIAQSEAATCCRPFVKYWLHHAFLTMSKEKMSKSLGNVMLARDFIDKFGGEVARYLLLCVHYRSIIDFSDDTLDQSLVALERIYESKALVVARLSESGSQSGVSAPTEEWKAFDTEVIAARARIDEHYANDFNTAGVLSELFTLIRSFNRLSSGGVQVPKASAQLLLDVFNHDIGDVLGVGAQDATVMLERLKAIRARRASELTAASGGTGITEAEILEAIEARKAARVAKNFSEADRIRKELESRGVVIKDSATGVTWSWK